MTSAPEAVPAGTPIMQRILGAIERGGNKMPNPAILFVWLCVIVILLSALLAWADIKVTYQVVEPPPITVEETVPGGSTQPSGGLPDASVQEGEYTVREETAAIQSLLSADGIRFLFTSFVANFRNFAAVAIILVVMLGVGLAEAAGLIGALIRKLVKRVLGSDVDADHRLHRRPLEHCLGCGVLRADTPGRGSVQERRAATRSRAWPPPSRASRPASASTS